MTIEFDDKEIKNVLQNDKEFYSLLRYLTIKPSSFCLMFLRSVESEKLYLKQLKIAKLLIVSNLFIENVVDFLLLPIPEELDERMELIEMVSQHILDGKNILMLAAFVSFLLENDVRKIKILHSVVDRTDGIVLTQFLPGIMAFLYKQWHKRQNSKMLAIQVEIFGIVIIKCLEDSVDVELDIDLKYKEYLVKRTPEWRKQTIERILPVFQLFGRLNAVETAEKIMNSCNLSDEIMTILTDTVCTRRKIELLPARMIITKSIANDIKSKDLAKINGKLQSIDVTPAQLETILKLCINGLESHNQIAMELAKTLSEKPVDLLSYPMTPGIAIMHRFMGTDLEYLSQHLQSSAETQIELLKSIEIRAQVADTMELGMFMINGLFDIMMLLTTNVAPVAQKTLETLAEVYSLEKHSTLWSCPLASPEKGAGIAWLVKQNLDYIVDIVGIRLRFPKVITVKVVEILVKIGGREALLGSIDIIQQIMEILEQIGTNGNFELVESMVSVLDRVVDVLDVKDKQIADIGDPPIPNNISREMQAFVLKYTCESSQPEIDSNPREFFNFKEPETTEEPKSTAELMQAEEEIVELSLEDGILLSVSNVLCQMVQHNESKIRYQILVTMSKSINIVPISKRKIIIAELWPTLMNRIQEPGLVCIAGLKLVQEIVSLEGMFVRERIQPIISKIISKLRELNSQCQLKSIGTVQIGSKQNDEYTITIFKVLETLLDKEMLSHRQLLTVTELIVPLSDSPIAFKLLPMLHQDYLYLLTWYHHGTELKTYSGRKITNVPTKKYPKLLEFKTPF